jgi:hypothetical protein
VAQPDRNLHDGSGGLSAADVEDNMNGIYALETESDGLVYIVLRSVSAIKVHGFYLWLKVDGAWDAYKLPESDDPQSRAKVIAMAIAAQNMPLNIVSAFDPFGPNPDPGLDYRPVSW